MSIAAMQGTQELLLRYSNALTLTLHASHPSKLPNLARTIRLAGIVFRYSNPGKQKRKL
jgi:hypothetical protein